MVEANFPRLVTIQKHYPDLGSDESLIWNFCARLSFWGGTVGGVAKCRPFSQAINVLVLLYLLSSYSPGSSSPLSPELSKNVFPVLLLTLLYQF